MAALALRQADTLRLEAVLGRLKNQSAGEARVAQQDAIAYLEQSIVEADQFHANRRR